MNKNNIVLVDDIEILIKFSDYAVEGRYSIIHYDINESNKYINIFRKYSKGNKRK